MEIRYPVGSCNPRVLPTETLWVRFTCHVYHLCGILDRRKHAKNTCIWEQLLGFIQQSCDRFYDRGKRKQWRGSPMWSMKQLLTKLKRFAIQFGLCYIYHICNTWSKHKFVKLFAITPVSTCLVSGLASTIQPCFWQQHSVGSCNMPRCQLSAGEWGVAIWTGIGECTSCSKYVTYKV